MLVAPTVTGKFFWGANYLVATPVVKTLMNISRPAWELLHTEAAKPLIVTPHYLPMEVRERIREDLQRSCWGAVKSAINGMAETDLGPELPSITQPTLVIIGDSDEMVPNSEGMLAAERMPNATLLKLPGVHHVVLDEAPDTTGPAIRQFLRGS